MTNEDNRKGYYNYSEYVKRMKSTWIRQGQDLRNKRELLGISQQEVGNRIGASPSLISKLELGNSVSRRELLIKSYQTALELILKKQQENILLINFEKNYK